MAIQKAGTKTIRDAYMTLANPYSKPNPKELLGVYRGAGGFPLEAVRWLQFELQRRGLYIYRIDGVYGRETQKAVHRAQKQYHMRMDGIVRRELLDRLEG